MKTTSKQNTKVKSLLTTFVLSAASVSLAACSGQSFSKVADPAINVPSNVSQQEQCEIDPTDYIVSANIYDFEVTDSTNVNFGFNLGTGLLKALGLKFNMTSGKLNLTMTVTDPMHSEVNLASVAGASSFKSSGGGVSLDIGMISAGVGYVGSTPFAQLTSDGLTNGLANATKKIATVANAWHTRVVQAVNPSTYVIGAGTKAGLKVGDQFAIYNVDNRWSGTPCVSELLISQKTTSTPIAIAQVTQVDLVASTVQIVSRNWSDAINMGASVEAYQLVGKNRVLNRAVRIGSVVSPALPVSNGQSIDIQGFAKVQFPTIVDGTAGYYLYQPSGN